MLSHVALLTRGALLACLIAFAAFPSFVNSAGPPPLVEGDSITAAAPDGEHARHTDTTLANARLPSQATFAAMFQGFAPGSRGAGTFSSSDTTTTHGIQSVIQSALPPAGGGAKKGRPRRRHPALNGRVEDNTRDLKKVATADSSSGIDLVSFENSLSQLLSQWSDLKSHFAGADVDSLVAILTSTGRGRGFADDDDDDEYGLISLVTMILAKYPQFADLWSWVELLFINIFQVLHGLTSTPYVHSAAAPMADGSYAAVDLDVMMQTAVVPLVEAAVIYADTTDSQIGVIAYALVDNFFKPLITFIASVVALKVGGQLQPGAPLVDLLDKFLLSVPQDIESDLSDAELALFCIVYDSISFAATAFVRITLRVINELIDLFFFAASDDDFIIKAEDVDYFLSIPERLALCGVGGLIFPIINPISPDLLVRDVGICLGPNLFPLVPILFRIYLAIFAGSLATNESGVAVTSPDYILGKQGSSTITLGRYIGDLVNSAGFYDQSCREFEDSFDEFQHGLQRLASLEQVLVDKSFASTRFTSNVHLNEANDGGDIFNKRPLDRNPRTGSKSGKCSKSTKMGKSGKSNKMGAKGSRERRRLQKTCKSKRSSGRSHSSGSSRSHSGSCGECNTRECNSFASAGVTNSRTCDAIERDDLNFLGSNCKIMTQIILDRFEHDEHIKDHLFDRYCDASNGFLYSGVDVPFLTRNKRCTKDNMCTKTGRKYCTVQDLPILREMFMPNGVLPKYMDTRPNLNLTDLDETLANVTAIPTVFTLRHFGSNQFPALELILMAITSHLFDDSLGEEVNADKCQPETSLPLSVLRLLTLIPGFGNSGGPFGGGATQQDDLIYSLIRYYFLGDDNCGPSYGVFNRYAFRRFFSCAEPCASNPGQQPTPVDDYASVFADIPLLADVGDKVTVLNEGSPYFERHPYNNDHDLLSLSLSVYFGNNVVIDCYEYDDIFEYIQHTIMGPIGISEESWYFPGSSGLDSPVLSGEAVSLTIEAQAGVVRDLLPAELELRINDEIPNSYAVLLSDVQEHVEKYYLSNATYSPWLGQGTCFMSSEAWTTLYSDHYINAGTSATTPQGYTFRNGDEHVFSTAGGEPRLNWSTLGEEYTGSEIPNSVIRDNSGNLPDECKAFGWGAYSSGSITVTDCPSSCQGAADERDISVSYISNQLDIFGFSFKSPLLAFVAAFISGLFINTGNPDDLYDGDPLDLSGNNPEEFFKIGTFLFAALGEWLFSSELPPIETEVFKACQDGNKLPVCGLICDYCESVVPNVCVDNSFALDVSGVGELTIPRLGTTFGLIPGVPGEFIQLTGLIGDDRSINCNIASGWDFLCSEETFCNY